MSKYGIRITLKREIRNINKVIDKKIIKGISYRKEAQYHKNLLARLALLDKSTFMARSMRVASFMMF